MEDCTYPLAPGEAKGAIFTHWTFKFKQDTYSEFLLPFHLFKWRIQVWCTLGLFVGKQKKKWGASMSKSRCRVWTKKRASSTTATDSYSDSEFDLLSPLFGDTDQCLQEPLLGPQTRHWDTTTNSREGETERDCKWDLPPVQKVTKLVSGADRLLSAGWG